MQTALCQNKLRFSDGTRLFPSDEALFASNDERRDFECDVSKLTPEMGFDLRFHAGYIGRIPLKVLSGRGRQLWIMTPVTPLQQVANATILLDRLSVPAIEPKTGGEAELRGEFVVGPGEYQVDWFIRDETGRACSSHWEIEAKLDDHFQNVPLSIAADTVDEPSTVIDHQKTSFSEHQPDSLRSFSLR